MITPEEIKEIRKLCDEATPGVWEVRCPSELNNHAVPNHVWCEYGWVAITSGLPRDHSIPNAAFIAAARTLVPRLLDEVEVTKERNEKLEADHRDMRWVLGCVANRAETADCNSSYDDIIEVEAWARTTLEGLRVKE